MMHRKTQIAAAVGAALFAVGTAAFGQAGPTVQAYGQISRTLLWADDGVQNKWFHTDNESSGTRFGLTGTAPAFSGNRAGFRIELDLQSNESQLVNFSPAGPLSSFSGAASGAGFNERHMDAWLEGGWGRMNIGQGDGAANGASESDLSGTGMANGIGVADVGGGFQYRNSAGGFTGTSIGASINQQDFESRYDRLMYTTPTFSGFRATASWGQNGNADIYEVGGWFSGKLGGMGDLAAAIGYSNQGNGNTAGGTHDVTMGGSVSWLLPMGLSLTGVWTERDNPTTGAGIGGPVRSSTFQYLKVGFKTGPHAIAVDWGTGEDFAAVGDEATVYGIGYVWNPLRWLELYAAYKQHELDRPGVSTQDIKIGHIGTRLRF